MNYEVPEELKEGYRRLIVLRDNIYGTSIKERYDHRSIP